MTMEVKVNIHEGSSYEMAGDKKPAPENPTQVDICL